MKNCNNCMHLSDKEGLDKKNKNFCSYYDVEVEYTIKEVPDFIFPCIECFIDKHINYNSKNSSKNKERR